MITPAMRILSCCALLCATFQYATAQKYPLRPIRLIAPFAPGGGADILSRVIGVPVGAALGQPVVVDNRPGAGGALGAEMAARADPDGYTLITVSSSYAASSAYHKTSYDPVDGIQSITLLGTTGLLMVTHPSVAAKSVKDLIDFARTNPGKLNYATVGVGSVTHFAHELFNLEAKIRTVHIPFKGGGPALIGVVSNEAHFTTISIVPTLPHLKAGRLRAIGISTAKRSTLLPDIPSIGETVPGYDVPHWYAVWGPKGIPKDIVALWNREIAKVLLSEDMAKQMRSEGLEPAGGPPEQFINVLRPTVERWRRVVRDAKFDRTAG